MIGPAVARIAITATDDSAQDVGSADLLWLVAGTGATGGAGNRGARIIWTTLAGGWRGFAVQAPSPSPALTVLAWNSDRQLLQIPPLRTRRARPRPAARRRAGPAGMGSRITRTLVRPGRAQRRPRTVRGHLPRHPAHDALLQGTVCVQSGCVVMRTDGDAITLLFPQSQIQPARPTAILTFRDHQYHDGDKLSVGGSETTQTANLDLTACPTRVWTVSPYN